MQYRAVNSLSRRRFIQAAAATSALAALPAVSWARVMGANDRIRYAVIGTGGMGTAHLHDLMERREKDNISIVKVCDVYRRRLNNSIKTIEGSESTGTMEYREALDDKDADCVLIATPDHWHTKIAIEAMEAGKAVYCEKPLSLTIEQAIECRNAVHRTGKLLQVGPQGTSDDQYWKARQAIGANRIGKVTWSQASYCRNSHGGQFNWTIEPDAGPNNAQDAEGYVWWDQWLGHKWGLAKKIDWNADHFFRFRKYWAYNGGVATDLLYHKLAPLLIAISGPDGEYPRRVVASGGKYVEKDERDIPDTFMMMADYPSEHTIVLVSVMTNDQGISEVIHGQHGTLSLGGDAISIKEQSAWWKEFRAANADQVKTEMVAEEQPDEKNAEGKTPAEKPAEKPKPAPGEAEFKIDTTPRRDHMGNFIDCIRGNAKPDCNVDLGCATMVAIKMAVESYRSGKAMMWDAKNEKMKEA